MPLALPVHIEMRLIFRIATLIATICVHFFIGCASDPGVRANPRPPAARSVTTNDVLERIGSTFPAIADDGPWNKDGLQSVALLGMERDLQNQVDTNPTALLFSKLAELKLFMYPGDPVKLGEAKNLLERSVTLEGGGSPDWIPGWIGLARVEMEYSRLSNLPEHCGTAYRYVQNAQNAYNAFVDYVTGPGMPPVAPLRPGISPEGAARMLDEDLLANELLVFDTTAGSSLLRGFGLAEEKLRLKRLSSRILLVGAELGLEQFRLSAATRPSDRRTLALAELDALFAPIFERDPDFIEASMHKYSALREASLAEGVSDEQRRELTFAAKLACRSAFSAAVTVMNKLIKDDPKAVHPSPDAAVARSLLEATFRERVLLGSQDPNLSQADWDRKYAANWGAGYALALEVMLDGDAPRYPRDGTVAAWVAAIQSQEAVMLHRRGKAKDADLHLSDARGALEFARGQSGALEAQPLSLQFAEESLKVATAAFSAKVER